VTVRYHHEDGGIFWGDTGGWTGSATTLARLRELAREGLEFTFGVPYRSQCYMEWGQTGGVVTDPIALEEFHPVEEAQVLVRGMNEAELACVHSGCQAEALEARVAELEAAIDEYALWEPGRRGHAEAHRKLMEARRA